MKLLVVIDVQNDFISGTLGSAQAQAILPKVQEKVDTYLNKGHLVMFTQDTHDENYLETQEGKNLPVVHCVEGTWGHKLAITINGKEVEHTGILKNTFGSLKLPNKVENAINSFEIDEVELIGVCTDICVVSNALILKARFPEILITVDASCCAGVTEESHKAALLTMKMCQVNVINEEG